MRKCAHVILFVANYLQYVHHHTTSEMKYEE